MSSASSIRHSHASRKLQIPANLIQNWQSSAIRGGGAKPLVRRPKTACERCRMAKVKCHGDGQNDCGRCSGRGLACRYTQPARSPSPSTTTTASSRRRRRVDEPAEWPDPGDHFGGDDTAFQQLLEASTGWPNVNEPVPPQQMDMDWAAVDPVLDWTTGASPATSLDLLSGTLPGTATASSQSTTTTNTSGSTPTSSINLQQQQQQPQPPQKQQPGSLNGLGLFPLMTGTTAAELSWQSQLGSQSCQCRAGLTQQIPKARAALQEHRLDAVCQVTGDVIQNCQDIVNCHNCNVNCSDLICIMAVFQEIDPCFEYLAQGEIDRPITVTMGTYEMTIDEADAHHCAGCWSRSWCGGPTTCSTRSAPRAKTC